MDLGNGIGFLPELFSIFFPHQFSNSLRVEGQPIVSAVHTVFVSVASRCHISAVSEVIGKKLSCQHQMP